MIYWQSTDNERMKQIFIADSNVGWSNGCADRVSNGSIENYHSGQMMHFNCWSRLSEIASPESTAIIMLVSYDYEPSTYISTWNFFAYFHQPVFRLNLLDTEIRIFLLRSSLFPGLFSTWFLIRIPFCLFFCFLHFYWRRSTCRE